MKYSALRKGDIVYILDQADPNLSIPKARIPVNYGEIEEDCPETDDGQRSVRVKLFGNASQNLWRARLFKLGS